MEIPRGQPLTQLLLDFRQPSVLQGSVIHKAESVVLDMSASSPSLVWGFSVLLESDYS